MFSFIQKLHRNTGRTQLFFQLGYYQGEQAVHAEGMHAVYIEMNIKYDSFGGENGF